MTRPTRFLVRMAVFVVAVLVVAGVLFPQLSRAFMANPVLNGLILLVALFGIGHAFRQVLLLNADIAWTESFRRKRAGVAPPPQPVLLAALANSLGERGGEMRLSALALRSLLDGIQSRLDEAGSISRYLIGLLIFLGLLGTFWGLAETVSSVGQVVAGLDVGGRDGADVFRDLRSGLEQPLGGMGTAFSSSLFGLAGALTLGFLELQASQAQGRFLQELEEWLARYTRLGGAGAGTLEGEATMPVYVQTLLEQTAETLDDLRRIVERSEEGRLTQIQSLQMLSDRLGTLTEQMQAEQNLLVRLAQAQLDMQPVLARIAEHRDMTVTLDPSSRSHLQSVDSRIATLTQDLHSGRIELMRELRNDLKLLTRTIANLGDRTDRGQTRALGDPGERGGPRQ